MPRWNCKIVMATCMCALALCAVQHWFVWNTTPSLPTGLYFKTWNPPRIGDTVLVCPPDMPVFRIALERRFLSPGLCPSGTGPLIKRIAALSGDVVLVETTGVRVNGQTLPGSARQAFGLTVANWSRELEPGEVLLMTPHPRSFDARYFGPLDQNTIITTLHPVWTSTTKE